MPKKMNFQTKNRSKTSIKCIKENPSSSKKAYKNSIILSINKTDLSDTVQGDLDGIIHMTASTFLIETNTRSNQLFQSTYVHENDDKTTFREVYTRSKNPGEGSGPCKDLNNLSFTLRDLNASSNDRQSFHGVLHAWSELDDVLILMAEKSMTTLPNYSMY